ncbi:hypothetical protein JKP88DRAFT_291433 [Tribonema minus]|uniref:histone acetyltransferase n=1 Tax=Tribonema minus TaxID=303371 RepID=A0A836CRH3_9STRA|nr:hypothetical protein JKP88DRAFT_291433 [Tribonema minus]
MQQTMSKSVQVHDQHSASVDKQRRLDILTEIARHIQRKRPDWARNRVLIRASELEEYLYSHSAPADYADLPTLGARVDQACYTLLMAKKAKCLSPALNQQQLQHTAVHNAMAFSSCDANAAAGPELSRSFGGTAATSRCAAQAAYPQLIRSNPYSCAAAFQAAQRPGASLGAGLLHDPLSQPALAPAAADDTPQSPPPCGTTPPLNASALYRRGISFDDGVLLQGRLLLLMHARACAVPRCALLPKCAHAKALLAHLARCRGGAGCAVPQCAPARCLLEHHAACHNSGCALCAPARATLAALAARPHALQHLAQLQEERKRKRAISDVGPGIPAPAHPRNAAATSSTTITEDQPSHSPPSAPPAAATAAGGGCTGATVAMDTASDSAQNQSTAAAAAEAGASLPPGLCFVRSLSDSTSCGGLAERCDGSSAQDAAPERAACSFSDATSCGGVAAGGDGCEAAAAAAGAAAAAAAAPTKAVEHGDATPHGDGAVLGSSGGEMGAAAHARASPPPLQDDPMQGVQPLSERAVAAATAASDVSPTLPLQANPFAQGAGAEPQQRSSCAASAAAAATATVASATGLPQ